MPVQSIGKRGEPADSGRDEGDGHAADCHDPGPREPGPREPGPREPGPREPGPRDSGPRDSGPRDPGPRDPGRRERGCRDRDDECDDDRHDRHDDRAADHHLDDGRLDGDGRDGDGRGDDPPVPLHVVPERASLDGLLSAALDTLDLYLRRACWHAVMVGYDTAGTLRFARDLGPVEARRPAGVSVAELRRRGVAGWYLVSFGLFRFESGDVQIPHPTLSAAAIAVELGRGGDGSGDGSGGGSGEGAAAGGNANAGSANYCIGQLGFVRPTGFVPTTLRLLSITTAGPHWGYTMLNELPI